MAGHNRLQAIHVDRDEGVRTADEAEQCLAIAALLDENHFELIGRESGPYHLSLSTKGARLTLDVRTTGDTPIVRHVLSFTPFRRVIQDYLAVCNALAQAAGQCDPYRIEAIDMARRAIHNEGSELLRERFSGKIVVDTGTARRLFTLIAAPHLQALSGGLAR